MIFSKLATGRFTLLLFAWGLLSGCEAPLDLAGVDDQKSQSVRRFDQFKSATATDDRIVVVGDHGVVLSSHDEGHNWTRIDLNGKPALIDVTACPDGSVVALDRARKVWVSKPSQTASDVWVSRTIETEETPLAITCDPTAKLWVTASFSTILSSKTLGQSWEAVSLDEDMQLGTIQFVSDSHGVITGEFGAFLQTRDGGQTWERGNDLPDEFFPLAAYFSDENNGWVSGLSGTILHTLDGGESWQRQTTATQAPLYRLIGFGDQVYAAGDNGTLLQLAEEQWRAVEHNTKVSSYFIAMAPLTQDKLLVAGGAGSLAVVPVAQSIVDKQPVDTVVADQGNQSSEGAQL